MTDEKDALLSEFKKRMHATLIANSESCSLVDFCRNFQSDWGSKKPVKWYAEQTGFSSVMQMLKAMPSEVSIAGDMLTVVEKEETKQNKDLIDRSQANKLANQKKRKGNVGPPAWATNPPLRTSLLDNLPPAPPGFCRSAAPTPAAVPPPQFAPNFFRPPVAVPQPVWSFSTNNWPNPMSFTPIVPPGYIGPAGPRPNYQQWSSINENHLQHGFGGFRPSNISNVGALLGPGRGPSANLYTTSLPPTSFGGHIGNVFVRNPPTFPINNEPTSRIVRNQLDGQPESVFATPPTAGKLAAADEKPSTSAFRLRQSPQGFSLEELEEGEIVDDLTGPNIKVKSELFVDDRMPPSSSTERFTQMKEEDDDEDEGFGGYNAESETEQCRQLLANVVIRRIPPQIHRIVLLLKAAGGTMTLKELQAKYEKKYDRKLTNIELRNVLGTPEARNTLVAFQQSPLAFLFHYELTIGGNVRVKLNVDPEDMDKLDAAVQNHCDGSTGSASARVSSSLASSSASLSTNGVSAFQRPAVNGQRAFTSSTVPIAMPSVSEIPLPPGTPRQPIVISEKKPSSRTLSQPAKDLLALATTAYDLTSTARRLPSLQRELDKQTAFRAFTHSPAQLLGLLMKHFEKCFEVDSVRDESQRMHLVIKSTKVRPADMVDGIVNFPQSLYVFPSVAEFIKLDTPTYAFILSHEPMESGKLSFIVSLAACEKTRTSLRNFLEDYGRVLKELKEAPLKVDSLVDGQYVLYLSSKTIRRCRVVKVGQSLRDVRLQCIDRGRIYEKVADSIYEFPPVSKLLPESFPALAVHCELADDLSDKMKEAADLFTKLKNKEKGIKISFLETCPLNNHLVYKVEMFVAGKDGEFKRWPASN